MQVFGLHWLDFSILILYIIGILWLGQRASRLTKDTGDFYIAGRRLGKFYQFFLNFGATTNADQAVAVSREIYRQGIGGMWIQYLVLFLTPFYWFTSAFMRRARQITLGDWFTERFRSRFLGGAFAVFTLVMAFVGGGVGYMVAGKTFMALTPKPLERYTMEERARVDLFQEWQELKSRLDAGLTPEEGRRYEELNDRLKQGELVSFVSYTNPVVVYFIFAVIVAVYTMMGGFLAAAITDVVQGFLIITFSVLLIPLGLSQVGGFAGLHARVPEYMFKLFGSTSVGEYAWYTIAAMALANLVSIIASAPMMHTAGSAKDEMTARIGLISGAFFKRFLMIFWALGGLLAVALFSGQIHDPDLIWGVMSRRLLFPGGLGLMLAGILAANMSTLDAASITHSALFIRNLYQPLVTGKSDRHYLTVGRVVIAITLLGGVGTAVFIGNLLDLFKYFISLPAVFGAPIWLGFIWRRLTKAAVIIQVLVCFALFAVIPNLFLTLSWARTNPAFLVETNPKTVVLEASAIEEDVREARADFIGQKINKTHTAEPAGIFFEKVARRDPSDPSSPKIGLGRFQAELWVLEWAGIDFRGFSKAQLVAVRFLFNALFPFLLLFLFSYLTKPLPREDLDRFFAKIHTPSRGGLEEDARAVEESMKDPGRFEKNKIWPGSNWEIMKPGWRDVLGFGGSCLVVVLVILLLWLMVSFR